jgi:hypothetical protein
MVVTTKSRTSRSAGYSPRKNPLRIATSAQFGPIPAGMAEPSRTAGTPEPSPGRVISGADLRAMRISEFRQWLGGQTNRYKRKYQPGTIADYADAAGCRRAADRSLVASPSPGL